MGPTRRYREVPGVDVFGPKKQSDCVFARVNRRLEEATADRFNVQQPHQTAGFTAELLGVLTQDARLRSTGLFC
jgi:hypothetical protein